MMQVARRYLLCALLQAAIFCFVCAAPPGVRAQNASAQDASAAWNAVSHASFDSEKTANVEGVTIVHDRIRITLKDGSISFSQRAAGVVFGAAFKGRGTIEIAPPSALEAQQLDLLTKQKTLNMDFTEATFSFTDDTFEQVAKQVKWTNGSAADLENLYNSRQHAREDLDAEIVPRVFEGVLDQDHKQTAYFAADVKTNGDGWVLARYDALEPEEISVGRYESRGSPALLFDTWMSFPAGNVNASQAYEQPTSKDVFAVHGYQIDATVTRGADLSATTKVNLQYQKAGERVLVFELSANLRVSTVKDETGAALPFFQPRDPKDRVPTYGDYVAVVLPAATQQAKTATLTFEYAGKHLIEEVGAGNYFCPSYGWYPGVSDDFATRSDFDMTFHTPKRFILVATGDKVSENTAGDWTVTHWKSPMPQAVSGFAYGDYKLYDEKVGNIDVQIYANRSPDDFLSSLQTGGAAMGNLDPAGTIKTMGIEIGNNLRVFQDYFGPFPFQRLAVTNIPYSYGQGWPMLLYLSVLSFLDETQRHELGVTDQIRVSDYFRAHEVSHQWWGHEVGWKSYHDQWLSEGFAQFSGNLYVEFRDGPKEYLDRLHKDREDLFSRNNFGHRYEDLGPVWMGVRLGSSQAPGGYDTVIYDKGGYVLEMLRAMLSDPRSKSPDEHFKSMMQDFTKSFAGKAASTEDFKAVVERHMAPYMDMDGNHRMDWFFNEYVYGTGIAQYHLDYSVKASPDNKWEVDG
ncbi:MAG TPA: M1 family aminopeptidase, partial [Candidatus Acidoferrales bacterium]|nr:M1 family aminopeptidase [Candidatus Acidoferrales bacterium]